MARKPRNLSPEERELWSKVAHTAVPLSKPKPSAPEVRSKPKPVVKHAAPLKTFRIGESIARPPATRIDLAPKVAERVGAEPLAMDRKTHRKLARGKLKPEARIDLHGMTLSQAHPALTDFILGSHRLGRRLVLVITGKGRGGRDEEGPIPVRRGVLRDQVPRWLRSPPCAGAVLQIVEAHVSHGGSGAWYVYLRRQG